MLFKKYNFKIIKLFDDAIINKTYDNLNNVL